MLMKVMRQANQKQTIITLHLFFVLVIHRGILHPSPMSDLPYKTCLSHKSVHFLWHGKRAFVMWSLMMTRNFMCK